MRMPVARRRRLQQYAACCARRLAALEGNVAASCWRESNNSEQEALHVLHGVAISLPWLQKWQREGEKLAPEWLARTSESRVTAVLHLAAQLLPRFDDDLRDFCSPAMYEELLATEIDVSDQRRTVRRQRGVYYTPPEIADFIVRRVHQAVRRHLQLPLGLADGSRTDRGGYRISILDPAMGSGVFLTSVIRHLRKCFITVPDATDDPSNGAVAWQRLDWQGVVAQGILPRITGWEILPPGVVAASLQLTDALHETGYRFESDVPLQLECRDALAPPHEGKFHSVIVGNPPYGSLSQAKYGWIEDLIDQEPGGYKSIAGVPLREKKHWLHDDYVKFFRLAQWHVEQAGEGVVGFIANHGYLQNASFRGLRHTWLNTFDQVHIVDLHGSAKLRERTADSTRDENVFGIASGVAINIAARRHGEALSVSDSSPGTVSHADLWGTRAEKLAALRTDSIAPLIVRPAAPNFTYSPIVVREHHEYAAAWPLNEAMPVNTTAPVTARDGFVVAMDREDLLARMERFCDDSISDDAIRAQFFSKTRSGRYPLGDSRGWKLTNVRRQLAHDPTWVNAIEVCQYRPFDFRYVLWHAALIDWPRKEVLRHLRLNNNLALLARRQSPDNQPANYFWATKGLCIDGVIRSDNKGSESLFPVWLDHPTGRKANFAPTFITAMEQATELRFSGDPAAVIQPDQATIRAECLAAYIYGLFWSPEYRTRHHDSLCRGFPRIVLPQSAAEYHRTVAVGRKLLELHTGDIAPCQESFTNDSLQPIAAGYPQWRDNQVWITATQAIAEVSRDAWEFTIGSHQVAKKWLKDRRSRGLREADIATYRQVVARLEATVAHLKANHGE